MTCSSMLQMPRTALRTPSRMAWILAVILATLVMAAPALAANRHHITLGLGFTKLLSDDLKDDSLDVDLTNAGHGSLSYRYSINEAVDITIDSRATVSEETIGNVDVTLTNSYFGPGVRWYPSPASPHAYLQANVYFVNETAEAEQGNVTFSADEGGAGFGLCGGVDLRLNNLLSLPLELHYLYAEPADDVSGLGFTVGLAFNFGQMP